MVRAVVRRGFFQRLLGFKKYRTYIFYGKNGVWKSQCSGYVCKASWVHELDLMLERRADRSLETRMNAAITQGGPHINKKVRSRYISSGDHAFDQRLLRMEREGKDGNGTPVYRLG